MFCQNCNKEILKNRFCSRSCIASFSNKERIKDDSFRNKLSESIKLSWKNKDHIKSHKNGTNNFWKDPIKSNEERIKRSKNMKNLRSNSEFNENLMRVLIEKDCLITSEKISVKNKENWKSEDYRNNIISKIKLFSNRDDIRLKTSFRIKELFNNEKYRTNLEIKSSRGISGKFIESGIHFASTWEAIVIYKYLQEGKKIERCPSKLRIKYINSKGEEKNYYPDFYIPEDNLVIEVKSQWQIDKNHREAKTKIDTAFNEFEKLNIKYVVMTEKEIFVDPKDKEIFKMLKENNIIEIYENKK